MAKRKKKVTKAETKSGSPKAAGRSKGSTADGPASESPAHDISIPRWLPWALYVGVTLVLFREFVASQDMLFGGDTMGLGYMARAFFADALKSWEFPFWNPIILGGTPFIESLAGGDSLYPPSVLLLALLEPYRALGWKLVVHVLAAGPLMALWMRSIGVSKASATICGLAYMVAPFFVSLVFPGGDGKMMVTALAPLGFWATERALSRGGLHRFAALAAAIALVILVTQFQVAYFLFGSMGVYAAFRTVQLARISGSWSGPGLRFGGFLGAAILGAGISAVQLLPAVSYVTEFSRRTATTTEARSPEQAIAYGSSYSLHPEEALSLMVPEFVGGNVDGAEWTDNTYWGRNFFKSNHEYLGWVILLLAGLSFFGAPKRGLRLLLFGLGAVALLFALGQTTPVWRIFYEVVPGIDLFRAPSLIIFVTGFTWITLAGFGIDQGMRLFGVTRARSDAEESLATRAERTLWGVAGGVFLLTLLWLSGAFEAFWTGVVYSGMQDFQTEALARARPFIGRGFLVTSLLTAATVAVWSGLRRSWLRPAGVFAALAALVFVDGVRIDDAYIETFDFQAWSAPDPNIQFLMSRLDDPEPWRLVSMTGAQPGQDVMPGMYGIELATGHHPNDLGRYRDLTGMVGTGPPDNLLANPQLLAMLNVRYLLWPVLQQGGLQGLNEVSQAVLQDGRVLSSVYELPALPRARLIAQARVVPEAETMAALMEATFDPAREVILNEEPPIPLDGGPVAGSVAWESRGNNRSVLQVTSDKPALLIVADNWFPAWSATVNGEPAPVLRAYHTLRAIPVGAGTSTVDMYYDRGSLGTALWISLLSLLVTVVAGATAFRRKASAGPAPDDSMTTTERATSAP